MARTVGTRKRSRRRILLGILAVLLPLGAAGAWAVREGIYLEHLPPAVHDRMPAHCRIPWGLRPEVRAGVEGLYSPSPPERRKAAYDLGNLGPDAAPAVPFLMALLADGPEVAPKMGARLYVRAPGKLRKAFDWLYRMVYGDAPTEGLGDLAGDEEAYALADIGEAAMEPLLAALHDPLPQVRGRATVALGIIGDPRAVGPLVALLVDATRPETEADVADPTDLWASGAACGAVKLGIRYTGAPAAEPLLEAFRTAPFTCRQDIVELLGFVGRDQAAAVTVALKTQTEGMELVADSVIADALKSLALPRVPRFEDNTQSEAAADAEMAPAALARKARDDPERRVRMACVFRLAQIATPGAWAIIRDVAAHDRCATVRFWARRVLGEGEPASIEEIERDYESFGEWPVMRR